MKKSIGGINSNLVACLLIIVTLISPSLGILLSILALIFEVEDNLVRYYAKHMVICGIFALLIKSIGTVFSEHSYRLAFNTIFLMPIRFLEVISIYQAYNLRIWEMPLISEFIRKIKF